ncbi:MAG: hypothetical protein Q9182_002757 [Xanthomendoza sp. 2 TL-2023]
MAPTITAQQWDERKEEILRLYIGDGLALKPVMRAMRSEHFDPTSSDLSEAGGIPTMVSPHRTQYPWPNVTSNTDPAVPLNLPIASPNSSHEATSNQPDIPQHWQDMVPYDPTSGEVFSSLPEAWRKDRKQAAALGYNPTGQPRTQRNPHQRIPQKKHSVPRKHSEEVRPNTADDPTMHRESVQPSWVTKSTGLQSCYPHPQAMIPAESAWWHGEETYFTASGTALPIQGAEHHYFHQF